MKVLMVVLVCVGVAGLAAVGGVWYVAHRVKAAVVEKAQENGVDLHNIVPPEKKTFFRPRKRSPCDLLSKEEASNLIGEPIEKAVVQEAGCMYYAPAGLAAKLAQDQASSTFKRAQAPGAEVNGMDVANAVDQLVNNTGIAKQNGTDGEMPLLMLIVEWEDGRAQMTAMNLSKGIFGGIFNAADPKGKMKFGGEIKGLGDQAVMLPKLGLNVLQGETLVRIIAGPVPDANNKSIEVARTVLKKL